MSISLIKILSYSIFIAEKQKKSILVILLKDYAKTKVNKTQFIFILMLIVCYEENNIFINNKVYQLLYKYIEIYENQICKQLLYSSF
jgi:hypothetical protein